MIVLLSAASAAPIVDDAFDAEIAFLWENLETGEIVEGMTDLSLKGVEAPWLGEPDDLDHVPGARCKRWAKALCWQGEFTTGDGGTGVYVLFGVRDRRGKRAQRLLLTYDATGARYRATMPQKGEYWHGIQWLDEWEGDWVASDPVTDRGRR